MEKSSAGCKKKSLGNGEEIVWYSQPLRETGSGAPSPRSVRRLEESGRKIVHRQYAFGRDGKERLIMELVLTRKTPANSGARRGPGLQSKAMRAVSTPREQMPTNSPIDGQSLHSAKVPQPDAEGGRQNELPFIFRAFSGHDDQSPPPTNTPPRKFWS
jgi:hypothetical protein